MDSIGINKYIRVILRGEILASFQSVHCVGNCVQYARSCADSETRKLRTTQFSHDMGRDCSAIDFHKAEIAALSKSIAEQSLPML